MPNTYLVLGATGRQGSAVVHALVAKGAQSIVVSSRNPDSEVVKKLLDIEGTVLYTLSFPELIDSVRTIVALSHAEVTNSFSMFSPL